MNRPLIAHILHRLDYGGLENGLVNLVNGLPEARFRHAVITLAGHSGFRERIRRLDVEIYSIDKRPGKDLPAYVRLWRLLRRLAPDVVHTRNPGVVDCTFVAWLAGVPIRVHGWHGWDVDDLHGDRPRRAFLRRACDPFVTRHVAVSRHIAMWLSANDSVLPARIRQIYNGVDTTRFSPGPSDVEPLFPPRPDGPLLVIGTVSRLEAVKDPVTLALAFVDLVSRYPVYRRRLRLAIVGDGKLRAEVEQVLAAAGCGEIGIVTGWRDDVPDLMRQFDLFVLPSLNEGISNTILEAMSCGLPVVATDVGGNAELVLPGQTGQLVPASCPRSLADALQDYVDDSDRVEDHGLAARRRVEREFSLSGMIDNYTQLYTELMAAEQRPGV